MTTRPRRSAALAKGSKTKSELSASTALAVAIPKASAAAPAKAGDPRSLATVAAKIRDDLARCQTAHAEWAAAALDLCSHLAEAKAKFKDTKSFGAWFDKTGIEMNKNDRAAAIAMGEEMARAKKVLETTERRSLRHIHDKEFRVPHVGNSTTPPKPKTPVTIEGEIVSTPAKDAGPAPAQKSAPTPKKAVKPKADVDHGRMLTIVHAFMDGKAFKVGDAANKVGGLAASYVVGLLQRLQSEPVDGYRSEPVTPQSWRIAPADADAETDVATDTDAATDVVHPGVQKLRPLLQDDDLALRLLTVLGEVLRGRSLEVVDASIRAALDALATLDLRDKPVGEVRKAVAAAMEAVRDVPLVKH